jgi:hypothetical protein
MGLRYVRTISSQQEEGEDQGNHVKVAWYVLLMWEPRSLRRGQIMSEATTLSISGT